ncbi:MAG: hypothetical protein AABX38_00565 [Candidatus Micrarchaeota archaeon]
METKQKVRKPSLPAYEIVFRPRVPGTVPLGKYQLPLIDNETVVQTLRHPQHYPSLMAGPVSEIGFILAKRAYFVVLNVKVDDASHANSGINKQKLVIGWTKNPLDSEVSIRSSNLGDMVFMFGVHARQAEIIFPPNSFSSMILSLLIPLQLTSFYLHPECSPELLKGLLTLARDVDASLSQIVSVVFEYSYARKSKRPKILGVALIEEGDLNAGQGRVAKSIARVYNLGTASFHEELARME